MCVHTYIRTRVHSSTQKPKHTYAHASMHR